MTGAARGAGGGAAPSDPLEAIKLKIERADRHRAELEVAIAAYIATKPHGLIPKVNPETGQEVVHIALPTAPAHLSILAGDVLHNLRSALDQLACRLAEANGAATIRDVYFPFGKDRKAFEASAERKIKRLSQAARDFIHGLRPYGGGNQLLWAIHDLNRLDKHEAVLQIAGTGRFDGVPAGPPKPTFFTVGGYEPAENEGEFARLRLRMVQEQDYKIEFTFDISFRDVEGLESQSVIAAMDQMSDLVREVVALAERSFFPK